MTMKTLRLYKDPLGTFFVEVNAGARTVDNFILDMGQRYSVDLFREDAEADRLDAAPVRDAVYFSHWDERFVEMPLPELIDTFAVPDRPSPTAEYKQREEFRALRNRLSLTQQELAEKLGKSIGWVRDVEQGRVPCPVLNIYAMRYLVEHPEP